nr:immunoglobulin heavy chain junction region [Macaca mulatta]
CARQDSTYDSW